MFPAPASMSARAMCIRHQASCSATPCCSGRPVQPTGPARPPASQPGVHRSGVAVAARGRHAASEAPLTSSQQQERRDEEDGRAYVAVDVPHKRAEDGTPTMRLVPADAIAPPLPYVEIAPEEQIVSGVHRMVASRPAEAEAAPVHVPGRRITIDPAELDLIGEGLPIIRGVRWQRCFKSCKGEGMRYSGSMEHGIHPRSPCKLSQRLSARECT
eukprot:365853-Chlamydomonas_euryale.AAC.6